MKSKTDILSFTYSSKGRDIDIVEPVLSRLEKDCNLKITRRWLLNNFVFDILRYRPKMLIQANAIGCTNHYYSCKFASMLGIKVVTFVSEGDYRIIEDTLDTMLFGWNRELKLYEDLHLEWSQRNIEFFKTHKGYDSKKVRLSGATGFDKYKLLPLLSKNDFAKKYGISENRKIIGLGGWTFDFQFNPNHSTGPIFFGAELEGIKASLPEVRKGYESIVKNNPDILFIAKQHPLIINETYDEFSEIYKYDNVIKFRTEENIYDLINVSDFWITFDSTTALEAWLIGKTTVLYNPVIKDFNRSIISQGSPILENVEELNNIVNEFYSTGKIASFEDLNSKRKQIITDVIGFDDGKNHIRAAEFIKDLFYNQVKTRIKMDLCFYLKMLILGTRNFCRTIIVNVPFFKRFKRVQQFLKSRKSLYNQEEREYYAAYYSKFIN